MKITRSGFCFAILFYTSHIFAYESRCSQFRYESYPDNVKRHETCFTFHEIEDCEDGTLHEIYREFYEKETWTPPHTEQPCQQPSPTPNYPTPTSYPVYDYGSL